MKLSRLLWPGLLALLFAAALLVSAPAHLLGRVLPPELVQMRGFEGTLWRGAAGQCLLRLPPGYLHLGAVRWSLAPLSLLTLAPRLTVESRWGDQLLSGELALRGLRDLDVADLEMQVSAALVQEFAPLAVDGQLSLQLRQLSLRDGLPQSAQGRLVWQQAGFQSANARIALGSYALDFSQPKGAALRGEVLTLSGPLQATGTAQLEDRHYDIDVLVQSDGALDPQLRQALSLMATPEGEGFRLRLAGDF